MVGQGEVVERQKRGERQHRKEEEEGRGYISRFCLLMLVPRGSNLCGICRRSSGLSKPEPVLRSKSLVLPELGKGKASK